MSGPRFGLCHHRVHMLILCAPNRNVVQSSYWIKDERCDVAVRFINRSVEELNVELSEDFLYIVLRRCTVYCCYVSPNIDIAEYEECQ